MHQTVHLSFKTFSLFCIGCLFAGSATAQLINGVQFDKLPQDYQLYPRNARNEAHIPIAGRVSQPNWQYASATLFRNKQAIAYRRGPIQYTNGTGQFAIDPFTIRAERAEYDVRVYLVNGKDSVNTVNRSNIVAGDVYVLSGQSNAGAYFRETRTNEFCRTFGTITGTFNTETYNPADTAWTIANVGGYAKNVGPMGFAFQRYVLDKFGIPTCLINGSMHWSSMLQHATRTPNNPTDLTNGYGRLLYRLQKAGVAGAVKALIFRQGETEAYGEGPDWPGNFDRYYQHLKTDLPSIQQLYLFQIDIINPAFPIAPQVREAQRQKARQYADIQVLASVGTRGFDGIHYSDEGYEQSGREVGRLVGRDLYGAIDNLGIDAPNIWRAYFSTAARDEITLLFAPDQAMNWTEQLGSRLLKNFIYLDGQPGRIRAGRVDKTGEGNKVILTLDGSSSATRLSYLPPTYNESQPEYPYTGPYLTNNEGLRALTFENVPIDAFGSSTGTTLTAPTVSARPTALTSIDLAVTNVPGAVGYVLEVQTAPGTFQWIAIAGAPPQEGVRFTGVGVRPGETYAFRVKAFSRLSESRYTLVEGRAPLPLAQPELSATATYANVVRLTWKAVPEATGYVVERRLTGETSFSVIATTDPDRLTLSDSALTAGQRYAYRIKATSSLSESPYAEAQVQTPAYLPAPALTADVIYNNTIRLTWPTIPGVTSYRLERQTANEMPPLSVSLALTATDFTATSLRPGTIYTFWLKAFGDRTESPVTSVTVQTPALLATPVVSASAVYADVVRVSWGNVPGAENYRLSRRAASDTAYRALGTFGSNQLTLLDSLLTPGTTYLYQLKAVASRTESLVSSTSATTPALLPTPVLSTTVLYNNAVRLGWTTVPDALRYRLLRRSGAETAFRTLGTFEGATASLRDTTLTPGTTYLYQIQALGERTESVVGSLSVATPALLVTPELSATAIAHDTLRVEWKAVPGVVYYQLERRQKGEATFSEPIRLDATAVRYLDTPLTPITTYEYRLTAFADLTRSNTATAEATTLVLLATQEPPIAFSVAPNPARAQVTLRFAQPVSGTVQLVDMQGIVRFGLRIQQTEEIRVPLTSFSSGTYLIRVVMPTGTLVKKLIVE